MTETYLYKRKTGKETDYNVWFAFPECYSFSMSSLGYLWIFKEIDEMDNVFTERITTDTVNPTVRADKVDIIGFSFSFDMDFMNMFKIMEKYKIPFKSKDRDKTPLIFGGGPVLTANPEPYKDIFDFMVIGDGEGVNKKAVEICRENRNKPKTEILKILSEVEGIYVPYIHTADNPVKKGYSELKECVYTPILTDESFFPNTFILETSRGCYNCCGFCIASYLNLPARFVEYETIINTIELGLKHTNKIALLGALVSAHPKFEEICDYIRKKIESGKEIEMSISSMRANTLSPNIIKTLVATGQKNITIAIEASTERLRKVINKNIKEEDIFSAIRVSKENGLKGVKIYAMLGLPTETQEDIEGFITLGKKLKQEFKGFDITFSFSTFVPKPHTPFQWCGREGIKSLESKINYLKKEFHKMGMGAKFSSPKWDYYQAVLSLGDVTLTDYLIEVYKQGGKLGAYRSAAKKLNIDTDKIVSPKAPQKFTLPWDVININPGRDILLKEYNRLMNLN